MQPHELISDYHLVLGAFGRWPGFHDGEVHRLVLDRTRRSADGAYMANIELVVRGWNLAPDGEHPGLYKTENDSLVHFLFEEVEDVEFDGFNYQNVLSELTFACVQSKGNTPNISVELVHCFGLCGSFKAARGRVVKVIAYVEERSASVGDV